MKVARTVWSGGKLGDEFKELPIAIGAGQSISDREAVQQRNGTGGYE